MLNYKYVEDVISYVYIIVQKEVVCIELAAAASDEIGRPEIDKGN